MKLKSTKTLTIDQLRAQGANAPIWALNGTNELLGQMGELHLSVPKQNGARTDPLVLFATWLPANLTNQIPRQQLLDSAEFLNAVNNGSIVLITPEFAQQLMTEDGAIEEQERVTCMRNVAKNALAGRLQSKDNVSVEGLPSSGAQDEDEGEETGVSVAFQALAESIRDKNDVSALNVLRNRSLTSQEKKFLRASGTVTSESKPKCWTYLRTSSANRS
jgi:hypothetical protein